MHVEKPPGVWRIRAYRRRALRPLSAIDRAGRIVGRVLERIIGLRRVKPGAAGEGRFRARAAGKLPLCLGGQPVSAAGSTLILHGRQAATELLGVVPRDVVHRIGKVHRIGGRGMIRGRRVHEAAIARIGAHHASVCLLRHFVDARVERSGDPVRDGALRSHFVPARPAAIP